MPRLLIVLTLPKEVRDTYASRLAQKFPELVIDVVDHHSKAPPLMTSADILITFGPMMKDEVFRHAPKLKWIQALGTGVDGITDQPSLSCDVVVTNIRSIHGAPVSEAALMSMLALLRLLPEGAVVEGAARFGGRDLLRLTRKELRHVSGRELAMVFQDPLTSLDPTKTIGSQVAEPVLLHRDVTKKEAYDRACEVLEGVDSADWAPEGAPIAVVRTIAGRSRLEMPIGKVLYESAGEIGSPRLAPKGHRIAIVDETSGDVGELEIDMSA